MTWLLVLVGCGILLLLWVMKRSPSSSVAEAPDGAASQNEWEKGDGSPASGLSPDPVKDQKPPPDLSKLKAAYQGLSMEALENILEMGARLKPGAEDFLRAEIERRRASDE